MDTQLRAKLAVAFRNPYHSGADSRAGVKQGCPNRARLLAGALTDVERAHMNTCPWCKQNLVDGQARSLQVAAWKKIAIVGFVLIVIFLAVSIRKWRTARRQ